jgi:hypothetical protein
LLAWDSSFLGSSPPDTCATPTHVIFLTLNC